MNGSYEKAWFDRVVHACGLVQDLDRLPNGEFTMLGTRGLSGGQRQRIVSLPSISLFRCSASDSDRAIHRLSLERSMQTLI
jgi:ABC-type bacteriocin/lantibiotic exporter with double-glycine peptidase domain